MPSLPNFFTGCNYWASHAGILMWRNWDADAVERDLQLLAGHGMTVLRVFPLWPDFQPLTRLYGCMGSLHDFEQDGAPPENPACVKAEMMERFRFLCDTAERNGMKLIVALLTGWMSGRLWAPAALEHKNLLTDPEAVQWEVRFVRHFVRTMKDHPAIAGWDLGNECNCMGKATSAAEAWNWMNAVASAIRMEDAGRPVISGMHSLQSDRFATWNMQDQGELLDLLTTHPYPLFTPECNHEPFNTMRNELHAAAESLLYQGLAGKPCFPEEAGVLGPMTCSEKRAALSLRAALFSCWANGLPGFLWWCAFDQNLLEYPPYDWTAIERELGLFRADRSAKPVAEALHSFTAFRNELPFELPPRQVNAVCLIPESRDGWLPALGSFLLSRQAGFDIRFSGAEQELPETAFYLLPSVSGEQSLSRRAWRRLLRKAADGANVLISLAGDGILSEFQEVTGLEIDARYQEENSYEFSLKSCPDKTMRATGTHCRLLTVKHADVLAETSGGNPVMTVAQYGKGRIFFINLDVENQAVTRIRGCFHGEKLNLLYLLYREFARLAGLRRTVTLQTPYIGLTEHPVNENTTLCIAVNYEPEEITCGMETQWTVGRVWRGSCGNGQLTVGGNDAAVFEVTRPAE